MTPSRRWIFLAALAWAAAVGATAFTAARLGAAALAVETVKFSLGRWVS